MFSAINLHPPLFLLQLSSKDTAVKHTRLLNFLSHVYQSLRNAALSVVGAE